MINFCEVWVKVSEYYTSEINFEAGEEDTELQ